MSWFRPVVLTCDAPDCDAQFGVGTGHLVLAVSAARLKARKEGWYRDLYYGDRCPIHRPRNQR